MVPTAMPPKGWPKSLMISSMGLSVVSTSYALEPKSVASLVTLPTPFSCRLSNFDLASSAPCQKCWKASMLSMFRAFCSAWVNLRVFLTVCLSFSCFSSAA